jgi:alkanesulfonate monooxygenase SsuD/methylene tetrahydromethanopterin reductase-like flavin-dependent oxidoreductase (luciferase family)
VVVDDNATADLIPPAMEGRMVVGSVDRIAEQLKTNVLDAGIDGIIMNLPTQGAQRGPITALGEVLKPLVNG